MYNGSFGLAAQESPGARMPLYSVFTVKQINPLSEQTPYTSSGSNRDSEGFLPLTVKQISDSDGAVLFLKNVKLVGTVFNRMENFREDVYFALDDQTGRIDCHRGAIDFKEIAEIINGTFVEIHGYLKGKNYLEAYCVRPVTDIDQLAHRFKESMSVHCHNTKSQVTNAATTNDPSSYQTAPSNHFNWQLAIAGIKQKLLDFLSIPSPSPMAREMGVHKADLAHHLNVPLKEIIKALETLEEDGLVYTTIDHYNSSCC
ncbi:hypothetical protein MKW94_012362 [Papaver nudicaule]|uniref:Replication protein A C-terminal domain-containing protein n=1 Tax=Papaver nudicaule TaxID=74823 RepID=A0AA41VET6_PAPNU|nr:hypothetical protein [Papaver nudicaule]